MNELQMIKDQANMISQTADEILKVRDEVQNTKKEMLNIKDGVENLEQRIERQFQEFKDTFPMSDGESVLIKSEVGIKAHEMTIEYFGKTVSKELFGKKRAHFAQGIYSKLKKRFNAIKYTTIKHMDFHDAKNYVRNLSLREIQPHFLKLTEHQFNVSKKNNDGLEEKFRGAHHERFKLVE